MLNAIRNVQSRRNGFTLVELMIVVAILGILATVALYAYGKTVRKQRAQQVRAVFADIAVKQEEFRSFNGRYDGSLGGASTTWTPTTLPSEAAEPWPTSGAQLAVYQGLGVTQPTESWFQYFVAYGTPGQSCTEPTWGCTGDGTVEACGAINTANHWWYAVAQSDQNGNGDCSRFAASSGLNGLVVSADEDE